MNRYRVAGEIISAIHFFWIIAGLGFSFVAVVAMMFALLSALDSNGIDGLAWNSFRVSVVCSSFVLAYSLINRIAQEIWDGCPMTHLENALLFRDNRNYEPMKSFVSDRLSRRIGLQVSPELVTFIGASMLAGSLVLLLLSPIVALLFLVI